MIFPLSVLVRFHLSSSSTWSLVSEKVSKLFHLIFSTLDLAALWVSLFCTSIDVSRTPQIRRSMQTISGRLISLTSFLSVIFYLKAFFDKLYLYLTALSFTLNFCSLIAFKTSATCFQAFLHSNGPTFNLQKFTRKIYLNRTWSCSWDYSKSDLIKKQKKLYLQILLAFQYYTYLKTV